MDLLKPDLGLFVWTLIVFLIVLAILAKFAWNPIANALKNREESIEEALNKAQKAREEMENMKAENQKIIREAQRERDHILKEARESGSKIVEEAKEEAKEEGNKILADARASIEKEKEKAFNKLKNQIGSIALDVATKIIRTDLSDKDRQHHLVDEYLKDANIN